MAGAIKKPKRYTHDGQSLTIREWAAKLKISEATVRSRLLKWPADKALGTGRMDDPASRRRNSKNTPWRRGLNGGAHPRESSGKNRQKDV